MTVRKAEQFLLKAGGEQGDFQDMNSLRLSWFLNGSALDLPSKFYIFRSLLFSHLTEN